MTTLIKEITATFSDGMSATLVVPNGTVILALNFYENAPHDVGQVISVVGLVSDPPEIPGTHDRFFTMIPDGAPIPATFKKYIATVPYGPSKMKVFVIEVTSL